MGCIVSTILVQFCYFWERNSQHSHKKMEFDSTAHSPMSQHPETYTPWNQHSSWKWAISKGNSSSNHQFSGATLVSGRVWGQRLSPVPQQISDRNGGRRSSPKGQHLDGENIGNCTNQSKNQVISLMFVLVPSNITNCKVNCKYLLIIAHPHLRVKS